MNTFGWTRRALIAAATATLAVTGTARAEGHQMMDAVHFLIPGGAGGGWDGTARGTGEALMNSGLVGNATYENMSGGGGGVAIANLIENAASSEGTLMVNSTPIVIRALTGEIAQSFRDLTPVGPANSWAIYAASGRSSPTAPLARWEDAWRAYREAPLRFRIGGGRCWRLWTILVGRDRDAGRRARTRPAFNYIGYGCRLARAMAGPSVGARSTRCSTGFSERWRWPNRARFRIWA